MHSATAVRLGIANDGFDLNEEAYIPYHKPNNTPLYIHAQSNHPPIIKKHLPQMIGQRISDLSCDKAAFEKAAPEYNQALQRSGFKHTIMYKPLQSFLHCSNNNNKKKRKQNIIWFNPPLSENVATNIGKVHCLQCQAMQQRRYALPTVLGRKIGYLVGRPRYNVE